MLTLREIGKAIAFALPKNRKSVNNTCRFHIHRKIGILKDNSHEITQGLD